MTALRGRLRIQEISNGRLGHEDDIAAVDFVGARNRGGVAELCQPAAETLHLVEAIQLHTGNKLLLAVADTHLEFVNPTAAYSLDSSPRVCDVF